MILNRIFIFFIIVSCLLLLFSCNQSTHTKKHSKKNELILERNQSLSESLQSLLINLNEKDTSLMYNSLDTKMVKELYRLNEYMPIWSDTGKWNNCAIDFLSYLDTSAFDGLNKYDYNYNNIVKIKNQLDSFPTTKNEFEKWAQAELLMTEAFLNVCQDIKQGRLHHDSLSWKYNVDKYAEFFDRQITALEDGNKITQLFSSLQPSIRGYNNLKSTLKEFIAQMDTTNYTILQETYKSGDKDDSIIFLNQLKLRLAQSNYLISYSLNNIDSAGLAFAIKTYQMKEDIPADGKISRDLIKRLNLTDNLKLKRILVNLDRYKNFQDTLPNLFIQANLPSYSLQFWNSDTSMLYSKIICGKPLTPTPILNSQIKEMILFPTWTVPTSIIKKEMLPQLKKNTGYLAKKGLALYSINGKKIDPATIDWNKYSKGIPYKIRQSSGEDNALGVIKFNFKNPFDVYLHDTNQRYLFQKSKRALSHGCVRVEKWKQLADLIARNDSINNSLATSLKYNTDSIENWIKRKQKHTINIMNPIPIYITYFTCEERGGEVVFYEDIYEDDLKMIKLYFSKN